jgi:hypothetical protein
MDGLVCLCLEKEIIALMVENPTANILRNAGALFAARAPDRPVQLRRLNLLLCHERVLSTRGSPVPPAGISVSLAQTTICELIDAVVPAAADQDFTGIEVLLSGLGTAVSRGMHSAPRAVRPVTGALINKLKSAWERLGDKGDTLVMLGGLADLIVMDTPDSSGTRMELSSLMLRVLEGSSAPFAVAYTLPPAAGACVDRWLHEMIDASLQQVQRVGENLAQSRGALELDDQAAVKAGTGIRLCALLGRLDGPLMAR